MPSREYPKFEAALSVMGVLGPDDVIALLDERARALATKIATETGALQEVAKEVPRLFLVEAEFHIAMLRAEAEWVQALRDEIAAPTMPGVNRLAKVPRDRRGAS